ncbi:MAG TPA: hypothetical protein VLT91_04950 [Rhizomicrobium sp.]|nr:hypothetical protein [Rhizomicrobium sp.]
MTTIDRTAPRLRSDSVFFTSMALAMTAAVFTGFARSWFLKSIYHAPPDLSPLMIVHGAVFTAWMAILIAQTSLVANDRRDIHRKLGVAGFIVAMLMLVLGTVLAVDALKRGFAPVGAPPAPIFFAIPIGDMVAFAALLAVGWRNRPRTDYHKRYMLLATITLLDAAFARVPLGFIQSGGIVVAFALADVFVLALGAYDVATRRRVHPATLIGGAIVIGSQVLRLAIGGTAAWQHFALWLAGAV